MGAILGKCRWKKEARVLFLGLDAAGKTTILYRTKLGEVVTTIPTIGFNVETILHNGLSITAWDVGGRDKMRPLFRHYFPNTDAIIYVIDSNDVERVDEAKEELHRFLREDDLRDAVVLVVANKQDLPSALSPTLLSERLELYKIRHKCHIIPTVAITGEGLNDVFEWLHEAIVEQRSSGSNDVKSGDVTHSTVSSTTSKQTDAVALSPSLSQRWSKTWEFFKSLIVAHS